MGGGCDFNFPEGTYGDYLSFNPITDPLTVPAGKRFYVLQSGGSPYQYFIVDGITITNSFPNGIVIIDENQVISSQVGYSKFINGILINANNNIELFTNNLYNNPFVVPLNKILVIQNTGNSGDLIINGNITSLNTLNNPQPFVLSESVILETLYSENISGYLVDENYFANCGGGGSSSYTSNATIDSLSQVVSALDSTVNALTSLFVFGCTDNLSTNYNSSANWDDGSCDYNPQVAIGDEYQGGIIFHIFEQGDLDYVEGETHGLIAATVDANNGLVWGCYGTEIAGAEGVEIGTGNQNTLDIFSSPCLTENDAAAYCYNLILSEYEDWFLPSINELNKMYLNIGGGNSLGLGNIGNFDNTIYLSSSEVNSNSSYMFDFQSGLQDYVLKNGSVKVRAVRTF
jgi:hypothetical protein